MPEVEFDLIEAYAWYESRRPGLGGEFLTCVDACIQLICVILRCIHWHMSTIEEHWSRRFPYSVFYEYSENTVTVYCVFHNSRDPAKWRALLESRS